MKQIKLKILGHVQGVSLRANTKKFADKSKITGWIKNENDGSVSLVAQGTDEQLNKLIKWLKSNPDTSKIETIEKKESQIKEKFEEFEILR